MNGRMGLDGETLDWIDGMARRAAVEVNEEQRAAREVKATKSAIRGFAATILMLLATFGAALIVVACSGCSGDLPSIIHVETPEVMRNVAVAVSTAIVDADAELQPELTDDLAPPAPKPQGLQSGTALPSTGLETPGSSLPQPADPAAAAQTDAPGETPDVGRFSSWVYANQYRGTAVHIGGGAYLTAKHIFDDLPQNWTLKIGDQQTGASVHHTAYDVTLLRTGVRSGDAASVSVEPVQAGQRVYLYGMTTAQIQSATVTDDGQYTSDGISIARIDADCEGVTFGDSGGGVYDDQGRLVGIFSAYDGNDQSGTSDRHAALFTPLSMVAGTLAPFTPEVAGPAHTPSPVPPGADSEPGYTVDHRSDGKSYWHDSKGRGWYWSTDKMIDGGVYGGRFEYRGGRMFEVVRAAPQATSDTDVKAAMLADPDQPAERFVLFSAPWCGPCKPAHALASKLEIPVQDIDCDSRPDLVAAFEVTSIPCWLAVRNGEVVGRTTGSNEATIRGLLE